MNNTKRRGQVIALRGKGWIVREMGNEFLTVSGRPPGAMGVYGDNDTRYADSSDACDKVAMLANAGDADAITAVLMCPDDPELQLSVARLCNGRI